MSTPEPNALQAAQDRLVAAATDMGVSLEGLVRSAYINGLLQSARITALAKLIATQNPTLPVDELLSAAVVDVLNEEIIPRIEAQRAPHIVVAGRH